MSGVVAVAIAATVGALGPSPAENPAISPVRRTCSRADSSARQARPAPEEFPLPTSTVNGSTTLNAETVTVTPSRPVDPAGIAAAVGEAGLVLVP
jgi:hypothetical protein